MKKFVISLVFLMVFCVGFVSANNVSQTMVVEANIYKPSIGIDVPERVALGDITKGYISERQDIRIKNTGTTDIIVTPEIVNESNEVFTQIGFKTVLSDPLSKIGFFELEIERPTTIGTSRNEDVYMYLDLTDYKGEISGDSLGAETVIIFWAVEA